jgi:hypothetical protein
LDVFGQLYAPAISATEEIAICNHFIGDWVGLRANLDTVAKGKSAFFAGIKPRYSSPQAVTFTGHGHFFPDSFQFIIHIHLMIRHCITYTVEKLLLNEQMTFVNEKSGAVHMLA